MFVYWLAKHPDYGEVARKWIERIEYGRRGEYITSSLTLYELVVILAGLAGKSLRDRELIRTVMDAISSLTTLDIVPLEYRDCVKALECMERYGLDYEDATHLAVALRMGATTIVSNDRDFDRVPIERVF